MFIVMTLWPLKIYLVNGIGFVITCSLDWGVGAMADSIKIEFSLGKDKFDNTPQQLVVETFNDFKNTVLSNRSSQKGEIYFCCSFEHGSHQDKSKFPELAAYRGKALAVPRAFLAFDFDGFSDVETYLRTTTYLSNYLGFGYETWSHSTTNPRARAILAISRSVNNNESLILSKYVEQLISAAAEFGNVKFDQCVYNIYQPIYAPPVSAKHYQFNGKIIDVDDLFLSIELEHPPSIPIKITKSETRLMQSLMGKAAPDETPRQIAILEELLSHINADCDYEVYRRVIWAILSTDWDCAEEIAYNWSITVPGRFNQTALHDLIRGFNAELLNCPSYGTIKYLARQGGWNGQ